MHTITDQTNHICLRFSATVTLTELRTAIALLCARPDYPQRSDLWLLGDCELELGYDALGIIVDDLLRHAPATSSRRRTALVCPPGLTCGILRLLAQEAQILPYEIQPFEDQQAAEQWLAQPGNGSRTGPKPQTRRPSTTAKSSTTSPH